MNTAERKTPWHLWVVGIAGLLWTGMGAFDYVMTQGDNEAYLSQFTDAEREWFTSIPTWAVATWATSVWSGVVGCILILLKSRFAVLAHGLSLIAFLLTAVQNFLLAETTMDEVVGSFAIAFSVLIFLVIVGLLYYSIRMRNRGVLR